MLSNGERRLFEFIERDQKKEFSDLFRTGVSINKFAENNNGQGFLGFAIEKKAYGIVEFLVDIPELISHKDRNGRVPLMYVSRHFDHKMLTLLQMKKIDLNQELNLGRNLLHLAATKRDSCFFDMLVSMGVDRHKLCDRGETPTDTAKRYRIDISDNTVNYKK